MQLLSNLPVFIALMQTHSTQRAAIKLGRSQSYVSKVLAQLREDLDDPLFVRSAEGLAPTSYAVSIFPKLQTALEQVNHALEPEDFDPRNLQKVCIHILEPLLARHGKQIILKIREQTDAIIEVRSWNNLSEGMLIDEEVDLGVHVLTDKPQTLWQHKLYRGAGQFSGNRDGCYIKFVATGVNENLNRFQEVIPNAEASIIVDNHVLLNQLKDIGYTLDFIKYAKECDFPNLDVDLAIILKASKRKSPKYHWLQGIVESVLNQE
ncbi:LysR family transcriptional regulator [Vibrio gallicus]|uniref:LysR family transcriptional regulator n=1 Tax=Vibrio gallicus TaxID=190897 RepID=UPI0021C3CDC2|nr:LysR family transcriptional regulator [Vibrio gallicus]